MMVTINLLKAEHGLRERYLRQLDRKNRWRPVARPIFVATMVLFFIYLGFHFTGKGGVTPTAPRGEFHEELKEPVSGGISEEMDEKGKKGDVETSYSELPIEPLTSADPARDAVPVVEARDNTKEQETPAGEDYSRIRVATLVIRANAVSLEKRLERGGFPASIRLGEAILPFATVSYSGLTSGEMEKVIGVFKKFSIDYTHERIGGVNAVFSRKIFIQATKRALMSEIKLFGLSGTQKRGKSKAQVYRVFLEGLFVDEELEQSMSRLAFHGFSPVAVGVK